MTGPMPIRGPPRNGRWRWLGRSADPRPSIADGGQRVVNRAQAGRQPAGRTLGRIASSMRTRSVMSTIALINPPFASVYRPSIALTQLAHVAQAEAGVPAQICYLNLTIARLVGVELYEDIADQHYMQGFGDWVFRALAYPDIEDNAAEYLGRMYAGSASPHRAQAERMTALRPEI